MGTLLPQGGAAQETCGYRASAGNVAGGFTPEEKRGRDISTGATAAEPPNFSAPYDAGNLRRLAKHYLPCVRDPCLGKSVRLALAKQIEGRSYFYLNSLFQLRTFAFPSPESFFDS